MGYSNASCLFTAKHCGAWMLTRICRRNRWLTPPKSSANSSRITTRNWKKIFFSRFRKANKLVDPVDVLLQQHQAGRRLTDITMHLATNQALKNADDRRKLVDSLRQFIRMY